MISLALSIIISPYQLDYLRRRDKYKYEQGKVLRYLLT